MLNRRVLIVVPVLCLVRQALSGQEEREWGAKELDTFGRISTKSSGMPTCSG